MELNVLDSVWIMVILQQILTHLHLLLLQQILTHLHLHLLLFKLNWLLIDIYHWHLAMVTITFIMKYIATIISMMNTNMHILFTNPNFSLNPN